MYVGQFTQKSNENKTEKEKKEEEKQKVEKRQQSRTKSTKKGEDIFLNHSEKENIISPSHYSLQHV